MDAVMSVLIRAMFDFEGVERALAPFIIPELREELIRHLPDLEAAREALSVQPGQMFEEEAVAEQLLRASRQIADAIETFGAGEDLQHIFLSTLRAARKHCQAQETLFPLRSRFAAIDGYFLEPGADRIPQFRDDDNIQETGLFHFPSNDDPYARGGYSLYVPEVHDPTHGWPVVVALHGGSGHGRDFIWTWLREARSRGFVLLSPSSKGRTWSILDIDEDAHVLAEHLAEVRSRYSIDPERIFITGMSDGGTFALAVGLSGPTVYRAIAPVSSALPPIDMANARGKRIFWIHGVRDWMFPVSRTVAACKALRHAGVDIRLSVLPDLSHAYPREANDAILSWFDPGLARWPETVRS